MTMLGKIIKVISLLRIFNYLEVLCMRLGR